jgi:hypothetical protein
MALRWYNIPEKPEDGDNMLYQNVGTYLPNDMVPPGDQNLDIHSGGSWFEFRLG